MKILFLSLMNGSYWGGSEEMWYRTALWMSARGHKIGICCYDWPEKQERLKALSENGASIYLLPQKKNWFYRSALRRNLANIPFEEYDLVFVNQGGYKEVVYPPFNDLHKRFKKYILCFHNYDANERLDLTRTKALNAWMQNAALNVGSARKIFEVIEENFGIRVAKKEIWVNPITINPPESISPYPPLQNGNYIWTVLAELDTKRKAQDLLIECLSTKKWKERNWQLHLYGRGKDERSLQDLIRRNGMEEKIEIKGFTNDIRAVLTQSHLLLQCTRIDAMPLSVVEAMALSRPCMVSNIGDMPYWIEQGKNGFVCNNVDRVTLDNTLEECWSHKDDWEELGKIAYETFKLKYPVPYEEQIAGRLWSL